MKTFNSWMRYKGLKETSAKKYEGAVTGILSEWARNNGLIDYQLISITSSSHFESVALKIRQLKVYQEQNERGHNMYHCALNKFAEYLSDKHGGA